MAKFFVQAKKGHDGFRRAGRAWPEKGVEVDTKDFSPEQLKMLEKENGRYLIVRGLSGNEGSDYKRFRVKTLSEDFMLGGQKVTEKWNVFNPAKEKLSKKDIETVLSLFEKGKAEIEIYDTETRKYKPLKEGEGLL